MASAAYQLSVRRACIMERIIQSRQMPSIHTAGFTAKLTAFIASRRFFAVIMVFFLLEAAWIALSGRYPMAFDEDFHLGIIRIYAHHLNPFWTRQPADADMFGAVVRDPSYLYHYLMSFPYRLMAVFTSGQTVQVLWLRFIDIGLFAASLPLYRRLLLKTGASRAVAHACLAIFILIPIVPLLAAQINYDNLLLPLTAATLLLTVDIGEEMKRTKRLNVKLLLSLTALGLLACLVKYAFLPIAVAIAVYLLVRFRQTYSSWRKFYRSLGFGFTLMTRRTRWLLLAAVVLAAGLFVQRYGVNLVRYHQPIPDCSQVLSVRQCSAYAPWVRDHNLAAAKSATASTSPLIFTADWFYGMWLRTFFAVDGPATDFQTRGPLVVPAISAIAFISIGAAAALLYAKRLLARYNGRVLWLFIAASAGYVGLLWLDGYQSFLKVGQATAINGRYLLPIMPLFLLICGLGWNELLRGRQTLKLAFAAAALLCMVGGGGALTYILRSNDAWYWNAQPVYDANHAVQKVLGPVTPGYRDQTQFLGKN